MALDQNAEDWDKFHKRYAFLGLPQVPDARIAAQFFEAIEGHERHVLLLGVTRVLTGAGHELTAVDFSPAQIAQFWPGDRPDRTVVHADWRAMELPPAHFTAAIGDGCLTVITLPGDYARVFGRVADALAPGGRLAIRCFVAPDEREALAQIAQDVRSGRERSFHAARWRVAMAATGPDGNIPVHGIYEAFREAFPDWPALAEATGWNLEAIETILGSFRQSPLVYSFPTRQQLLGAVPDAFVDTRLVPSEDYPLAERCPFLLAERRA